MIFTGAPLPSGNHAIIPKENCTHFIENNCVIINKIPKQNFIRKKGFDTFDDVFNNSYDEVENDWERFQLIMKEVNRVCFI